MRALLVFVVIGVSFFDTLAQLPVVAPYARHLGAPTALVGLTVAAYSLANMVGNLLAGPAIDRYGRKPSIVAGMLVAAAGVALASLAVSPAHFLGARVVHGLGGAVLVPAAFAYVGDRSAARAPDAPGRAGGNPAGGAPAMARSGIAIGVAALTGPPLAGVLRDRAGYDAVFLGIALLLVVTAALSWLVLPEPRRTTTRQALSLRDFGSYRALLRVPLYRGAVVGIFCLTFGKGILAFALPLHAGALGYGAARVGLLMSGFAFSAIAVFALTGGLRRLGLEARVLAGLGIVGVALGLLGQLSSYGALMGVMLFYGIGFGLLFPSTAAQVVTATTTADRGRAFGLFYAFFSLGVVLGPVLAGLAQGAVGLPPFLVGAVVVLAGIPAARRAYRSGGVAAPAAGPRSGATA